MIQQILNRDGDPVFLASVGFSIEEFARLSHGDGPTLVLQDGRVFAFSFIRRNRDIVLQWDNGKMKPKRTLFPDAITRLREVCNSNIDLDKKRDLAREILGV